jgi:hypothetical protein
MWNITSCLTIRPGTASRVTKRTVSHARPELNAAVNDFWQYNSDSTQVTWLQVTTPKVQFLVQRAYGTSSTKVNFSCAAQKGTGLSGDRAPFILNVDIWLR